MDERIYRTPRGYDTELSHYPSYAGRCAENVLLQLSRSDAYRDFSGSDLARRACAIAEAFAAELQARGWLLPVEDALFRKTYRPVQGA